MTKPCAHCGGYGRVSYAYPAEDRAPGMRCDACGGTGKTDDAEYESEICANCEGNGCGRCRWTGEVWRKVDGETTEGDE